MPKALIHAAVDQWGRCIVTVDGVYVGSAWYMRTTNEWIFEPDAEFIPSGSYSDLYPDGISVREFAVLRYNEAMSKKS